MTFDASPTARERIAVGLTYVLSLLILGFLVLPIMAIMPLSFTHDSILSYPIERLSLRWYRELIDNPVWATALENSLIIAAASTLLATFLGTLASIGLSDRHCPASGVLTAFLLTPMIVPVVITGVASYFFYAGLGLTNSIAGMILAHGILGTPFVVITAGATLQGFDPNQRRAAHSLGARPGFAFRTVILPQIAPGVLSGALFAFVTSFDEVIVSLFIAGTEQYTLPRRMFAGIRENLDPTIAAVATVMIAVSIAILALAQAAARGRKTG